MIIRSMTVAAICAVGALVGAARARYIICDTRASFSRPEAKRNAASTKGEAAFPPGLGRAEDRADLMLS